MPAEISPIEAHERQSTGSLIIDVRERDEYTELHATGAVNIPLSELTERFQEVPSDRDVLVICHSGGRSARACAWLDTQGITATNIAGGTVQWAINELPVTQP